MRKQFLLKTYATNGVLANAICVVEYSHGKLFPCVNFGVPATRELKGPPSEAAGVGYGLQIPGCCLKHDTQQVPHVMYGTCRLYRE